MGDHGGLRRRHHAAAGVLAAVVGVATVVPVTLPSRSAPLSAAHAANREARSEVLLRTARTFALRRLARTERRLGEGRYPTVAPRSRWHTSGTTGWLAGFHAGSLWLAYEASGRPVWARRAAARQAPLAVRQHDTTTHDLGFLLQTSFGRGAALTGSASDAEVTVRAAAALASRWVPRAGAIRSWNGPDGQVTVIVDNLVNLQLLFSAARIADRPEWRELAHQHALTSAEHHVRGDGSTTHVVRFDETTGRPVWSGTRQGLRDDSTWARGQSWAVYGFTGAYRETRDARLLAAARATADFAVGHLPADGVPYWDYDAPATPGTTRDTTAAAVLAAGLVELARVDPDRQRQRSYSRAGMRVLRALAGPGYLARGSRSPAVLLHGHHDATYSDAGVTYGDHYFLEALLGAQLLPAARPALRPAAVRRSGAARTTELGSDRKVSGVSVRVRDGATRAVRLRVATSRDGRRWTLARSVVTSGRTGGFETYDVPDRVAGYVRVTALGTGAAAGTVRAVRVRG